MNIRQLEIFCEAAKTENLSKAAEKFMLPSSAVSALIKRLEDEVGVTLFNRTSNRISLTSEGRTFANKLNTVLPILRSGISEISGHSETQEKINVLVRTRPKWVAEMIENFLRNNSNVIFTIKKDYSENNFNNYNIIISPPIPVISTWDNFLLSTETSCIKAHKGSPLINAELNFEDIASMPFILHSDDELGRIHYEKACANCGVKPNVLIETNESLLLESFVKSGLGLTVGSLKAIEDKYSSDMIPLNVKNFNNYYENVFVYYKEEKSNVAIKKFCNFLYKNRSIT